MEFEERQEVDNRRFPVTMTFRCSVEDRETIRRRARETGHTLSTFLRKRAVGGQTSKPIQDVSDLAELRQHFGLCKQLIKENRDVRPLLRTLENLIAKMSTKVG